jgi:hypothetical protein
MCGNKQTAFTRLYIIKLQEIAPRCNAQAPPGLLDHRQTIAGAKPLVDPTLQAELELTLQQPPSRWWAMDWPIGIFLSG